MKRQSLKSQIEKDLALLLFEKLRDREVDFKKAQEIAKLTRKLGSSKIYCPVNKKHPYLESGVIQFWEKNGYEITGETK